MFSDNFKTQKLELLRIKDLNEFGINLDECQILFSQNLQYGIIYSQFSYAVVDLNKRTLISKYSNDKTSRISKLKITSKNNITYINRKSNTTEIFMTSLDYFAEYYELKIPEEIIDYVYLDKNSEDNSDFLFILTSKGDLFLYRDLLNKKKVNILTDTNFKVKIGFSISHMEFIEETQNLLLILSNGTLLNYTVSNDPEKLERSKTINFEEMMHLDIISRPAYDDNNFDNKIYSRNSQYFEVSTFKITKCHFNLDTFIIKDDLKIKNNLGENEDIPMSGDDSINKTYSNNNNTNINPNNRISIFISIGYTKNKSTSFISIFEMQSNQLVYLNKIELKNKIILDSFIYQPNLSLKNSVPDYFLICCKTFVGNKIEILASDFLECLRQRENPTQLLSEGLNVKLNLQDPNYFITINEMEDNSKIKKLGIMGVYVTNNSDILSITNINKTILNRSENLIAPSEDRSVSIVSNINDYKNINYSVNLILRTIVNFNCFDAYLMDHDIQQSCYKPPKKLTNNSLNLRNFDDDFIKYPVTTDVNKHLEFFEKNNNLEYIISFKKKVLHIITENILYNNFINFTKISENDNRINFYLLLLLFNGDIFAIKYYLLLKENITMKQFLVSNSVLFYTVNNIFYYFIKKIIFEKLKNSDLDYTFFTSDKIYNDLLLIFELIKISKSRNENPYEKPFSGENSIISEDNTEIENVLVEIQNIIMIIRIIRSYMNNIIKNESVSDDNIQRLNDDLGENMHKRKRIREEKQNKENFLYFELIMHVKYEDIYPSWKRFFTNYFNSFFDENLIVYNKFINYDILYFTKFQLFFYYFYYVMDYLKIKEMNSEKNRQSWFFEHNLSDENKIFQFFEEMDDEFKEYYKICFNFYKLDYNLTLKAENQSVTLSLHIDISTISNFLYFFNKNNLSKNLFYVERINFLRLNFNSLLISLLFIDDYSKEALTLSKNILTLIKDYDDLLTQLNLLLDMKLINLAYQFVNNCFACLVFYSNKNDSMIQDNLLKAIVNSEQFSNMKNLYFYFFNYLVTNNNINILFSLPYNFIERYLMKEFLMSNKHYEELLLLYFIKIKKLEEAMNCYNEYQKNSNYSNESKELYFNLIESLKMLFVEGKKEKLKNELYQQQQSHMFKIEVNITSEKSQSLHGHNYSENKPSNDTALKVIYDSIFDVENMSNKPSMLTVNDNIKSFLSKKQETAKKTFGLFTTDIKNDKKLNESQKMFSDGIGKNYMDSSYKSFMDRSKSPYVQNTPLKRPDDIPRPLLFNSNSSIENNFDRNKMSFDKKSSH